MKTVKRILLAFGFVIFFLHPSLEGSTDQAPPKKPAERFTVFVYLDESPPVGSGYSVDKILEEVKKRIKKRGKWLVLTENQSKANISVQILGHRVRQEHVTKLTTRVRSQPRSSDGDIPVDYVDTNYFSERHYIETRVDIFAVARILVGHDGREKGASLKGAASALARQLEDLLKNNYWDLEQKRRAPSQPGPTASRPPVMAPSEVPVPGIADSIFPDYLRCIESYRKGDFETSAGDVSSLTREELQELSDQFLARDRTDTELKAAALLHTECVITVEQPFPVRPSVARLHAYHLNLALRYSHAIKDPSSRVEFQKRWYLTVGHRFHTDVQPTRAIALLTSGLRLYPNDSELSYALAACFESWGDLKQNGEALRNAESIYRKLAVTETRPDINVRLAHVLIRLDRLDEAEELLEQAIRDGGLGDSALAAWMLTGEIAEERNRWDDARDAFRTAWELDPGCQACTVALALAHERSGDADAGHALIKRSLEETAPTESDGWWRFLFGDVTEYREILGELRTEVN
jgi:tetratricopeptide (TPR) repeat protein